MNPDPSDFLSSVQAFPEQIEKGWDLGMKAEIPSWQGIESVAVLGMGGSGISGDVLSVAMSASPVPVTVVKGYSLPAWVGAKTLVLAASYSGNTEETLEAHADAKRAGAKIVCVTTGGKLAEAADGPVISIPSGLQPRAALGYLSMPLLAVCARLGLFEPGDSINETIACARNLRKEIGDDADLEINGAKQIASELVDRVPIIYASIGLGSVAAYRWKCQLNECSKVPAFSSVIPELDHNEIVGWGGLKEDTRTHFALVLLRSGHESARITKRFAVTLSLIKDSFDAVIEVRAHSDGALSRLIELCYTGDFVATYLAIQTGVDPAPVEVIEDLKRQLA